ncbi:MAG TPA: hypothetical protein VNZ58_07890 [Thermomicrobiales bacterium]|nr:hypothetical protein [Thermomicrobiales bacterium]
MTQHPFVPASRLFDARLSRRHLVELVAGGTALGLSGALLGPGRFVAAQATPPADLSIYPEVTITAEGDMSQGYSFGVPDSLPTGYVKITLDNKSEDADHHAMFLRPNDGVTADQLVEKIKASTNPGEFVQMAVSVGGPGSVSAGQSSTVIMNLEEGSYVLICEVPASDGTPHYLMGMVAQVEAKASGTPVTTAPTAETTVDLVDFAFDNLPTTVTTGQHIWEVHNSGTEEHEIAIFQLAPGITGKMMYGMLAASEAPAGTPAATAAAAAPSPAAAQSGPPFIDVAGAAPMDPDNTNWVVIDLQPGDYTTVCFVPDPKTGKPHFMLGMFAEFSVQ